MKKIKVSEPVIVYQGTDQPVLKGGNQDPQIRKTPDGDLIVWVRHLPDCPESEGYPDNDTIFRSGDMGKTWRKASEEEWMEAIEPLPNGDKLQMRWHKCIFDLPKLPELPDSRKSTVSTNTAGIVSGLAYTYDELSPVLKDKIKNVFLAERKKKGESEWVKEECVIHWDNMPYSVFRAGTPDAVLRRMNPTDKFKVDKNGVMWMTAWLEGINSSGEKMSERLCTHLLKSEDFGHNWYYVSTIPYKEEYNESNYGVEGFTEATIEFVDDGMIVIMRSGSLFPGCWVPMKEGDKIPKLFIAKTKDGGKTWSTVKPLFDYGIRPHSVKLDSGTIILTSGRPGVYIAATDDKYGLEWGNITELLSVPKENIDKEYYEYSCSNNDICAYDKNTAFVTYSNFQLKNSEGKRAKSIIVRKITVED